LCAITPFVNLTALVLREKSMWGYTIIGRDGGEAYTSEPEYESEMEAYKAGDLTLCDMNEGSMEVWED
jgi:hypothetical protein